MTALYTILTLPIIVTLKYIYFYYFTDAYYYFSTKIASNFCLGTI